MVYKAADERSEREDEPNQMNGHFRRSSDSLIVSGTLFLIFFFGEEGERERERALKI